MTTTNDNKEEEAKEIDIAPEVLLVLEIYPMVSGSCDACYLLMDALCANPLL